MTKLETLIKLDSLVSEEQTPTSDDSSIFDISGQNIVVLDRGFVYVGDVSREGDFIIISNAKNIRKWGTTRGLGELVNGPLTSTVLDPVGSMMAPLKALMHLIPCKGF